MIGRNCAPSIFQESANARYLFSTSLPSYPTSMYLYIIIII